MAKREKLKLQDRPWWSKWKNIVVLDAWEHDEDSLCATKYFESCEAWCFIHHKEGLAAVFHVKQLLCCTVSMRWRQKLKLRLLLLAMHAMFHCRQS